MKAKMMWLLAFLLVSVTACKYDDGEIWDKVNSLDDRVTSIEEQLKKMNNDISALQTIINALQNNVYVASVENTGNGCTITFSNGEVCTITNGKDGKDGKDAPVITIAKSNEDGKYYWMQIDPDGNKNWLLNPDTGEKIPVTGKDAITPQLKVDASGYWLISYDGGITFTTMKDENGNPIKAVGEDGKDGKDAPVITIAKSNDDGKFYWMQIDPDGSKYWLLNPDTGEKIPVTGKDAITPQLKVDASGYWLISYDGGITFTTMKDVYGNPIKAVGEDGTSGDSFFNSVRVEGDMLILVLADGSEIVLPINTTGIPSDQKAQPNPDVSEEDINTYIPNFSSPILEDGTNGKVARISLTGIQTPANDWLKLYGTDDTRQNIWMEIDGKPKSIAIINSEEAGTGSSVVGTKAQADVVFLVDNSGSMNEEADAVAREILSWAEKLSKVMDVKFACVGYNDWGAVCGALNITDVADLSAYLNRSTGTYRTKGYAGSDAETLEAIATSYDASGECGATALRFADEQFNFRIGANRIYVNLTDEPNQPGGIPKYSVESVNAQSEYYEWNTARGTIHTVFSGANYGYTESYNWTPLYEEKPWLMSEYTGGTAILDAPSNFSGVTLVSLPVTGAITNSYIIRFNVTPDLLTGKHTVKITIISADGSVIAEKVFEDIEFV